MPLCLLLHSGVFPNAPSSLSAAMLSNFDTQSAGNEDQAAKLGAGIAVPVFVFLGFVSVFAFRIYADKKRRGNAGRRREYDYV